MTMKLLTVQYMTAVLQGENKAISVIQLVVTYRQARMEHTCLWTHTGLYLYCYERRDNTLNN